MKKIVVIGGGTGTFVVLSGLKKYPADISVIVSMMDSGGSTGRLRDQLGVLPPGDLRQCLVALSEASDLWRKLFLYRFESGDLKGHNFGNIFITALEKIILDYQKVVETASFILKTKGKVIPVTHDKVHLCVEYEDGEIIESEAKIDGATHQSLRIKKAYLKPKAKPNKLALKAISESDFIIIGPGDLYTSLIPNLIVEEVAEAIYKSKAKIINIMNLMTKKGQTTDYQASNHLDDLEKYLKKKINIVLLNNQKIPKEILDYYQKNEEKEVIDDIFNKSDAYKIIKLDLISNNIYNKAKVDTAVRSLLRHDSEKAAEAIWNIINS